MNQKTHFTFMPLRLALSGAALLLVPLLFWLWLAGLRDGGSSPAVSAPVLLEPEATIRASNSGTDATADSLEVVATYPPAQVALRGERPTVAILVTYELNSADEAELIVRLNEAMGESRGRGVVSASQVITRGRGTVALPLTIDRSELTTGQVSLSVLLRDTSADSERLLFLDFPADYQWSVGETDSQLAETGPGAAFLGAGQPQPFENGRLVTGVDGYEVTLFVAYDLADYEQGYVTLGFEYQSPSASSSGGNSQWISGENSIATFPLVLEPEFFNEDGSLREEVIWSVQLSALDPSSGEDVVVFPEEAVQAQLAIPERLEIQSVVLAEDETAGPALAVTLWYERRLAAASVISLTVETGAPEPLAAVEIPTSRQRDSVTALLPLDLTEFTADFLLRIVATLETGEQHLTAEHSLQVGELTTGRMNEVWLNSAGWQTATVPTGDLPYQMNLAVGYALAEDYQYGALSVTVEQQALNNQGGGSGGGSHIVEPGVGSYLFSIPAKEPFVPEAGQEWPAGLSVQIELRGVSDDGTESVLSVWSQPAAP